MPTEYYGTDSGRYFDADVVGALENHPWTDPSMTRGALDSTFVGGSSSKAKTFITKKQITTIIEKFKKQEKEDFIVSSPVYAIIATSVTSNIDLLLQECVKISPAKKLTVSTLYKALTKNAKRFAHMSYVWK